MKEKFIFKSLLIFTLLLAFSTNNATADVNAKNNQITYDYLLKDVNTRIASQQARVASRPNEWLIREKLIAPLYEKALLTNDIKDYQNAQQEIEAAVNMAPQGSGPLLFAAKFNYAIHRLSKAEQYLQEINTRKILKSTEALAILIISSDIAFQKGDYAKALEGYRLCETYQPGVCTKQLIIYYNKTGGYTESEAMLKNTIAETAKSDLQTIAWLNLQLGILFMERGKLENALKALEEADRTLPDWWLVREHIAEVYTLMKKDSDAQPIYENIVRTTNLPQYMDALAAVYKRQGKEKEAAELIKKAENLWEELLKIFPESASGHALEHYFEYNGDNKKILALAENNFKTRPNSEARVFLAKAYIKNNELKLAKEQIDAALATPYKSSELFDTAREIYSLLGDNVKSESYKILCQRINPQFYN